jgi:hypothetical protein
MTFPRSPSTGQVDSRLNDANYDQYSLEYAVEQRSPGDDGEDSDDNHQSSHKRKKIRLTAERPLCTNCEQVREFQLYRIPAHIYQVSNQKRQM